LRPFYIPQKPRRGAVEVGLHSAAAFAYAPSELLGVHVQGLRAPGLKSRAVLCACAAFAASEDWQPISGLSSHGPGRYDDNMGKASDKPKRHWFQFSLRALLIVMLVVSLPLGWIGWEMEKTRREQAVVAQIEKCGGYAWYHESSLPSLILRHFRRVQYVEFGDPFEHPVAEFNLAPLEDLQHLTNLEQAEFWRVPVTDAELVHLKAMTNLKNLYLVDTQITAEGIDALQRSMPHCNVFLRPPE